MFTRVIKGVEPAPITHSNGEGAKNSKGAPFKFVTPAPKHEEK